MQPCLPSQILTVSHDKPLSQSGISHNSKVSMQIEVFSELRSKKIANASLDRVAMSGNSSTSLQSAVAGNTDKAVEGIFHSAEDRQLLLALLLHCADIGNSVLPYHIAERYKNLELGGL